MHSKYSLFKNGNAPYNERNGGNKSMCGRFYTDNEIAADILRRAGRTADNLELPNTGDIYPSQQALILSGRDTNCYNFFCNKILIATIYL